MASRKSPVLLALRIEEKGRVPMHAKSRLDYLHSGTGSFIKARGLSSLQSDFLILTFIFPNLEYLSLDFTFERAGPFVTNLALRPDYCPGLLTLEISTRCDEACLARFLASGHIANAFPRLEHFYLHTDFPTSDWEMPDASVFPPLRTLHVVDNYSVSWIKGVIAVLRHRDV